MSPDEALKLCRLAKAASPAQAVDDYTPDLWALALRNERFVDAQEALVALAREQEWIHLSHIVARVKRLRTDRIREFGPLPNPPAECVDDPAAYARWYADTIRQIADGEPVERPALEPANPEQAKRVKELLAGAFRGTDDDA
jgi:hypothetical protein